MIWLVPNPSVFYFYHLFLGTHMWEEGPKFDNQPEPATYGVSKLTLQVEFGCK